MGCGLCVVYWTKLLIWLSSIVQFLRLHHRHNWEGILLFCFCNSHVSLVNLAAVYSIPSFLSIVERSDSSDDDDETLSIFECSTNFAVCATQLLDIFYFFWHWSWLWLWSPVCPKTCVCVYVLRELLCGFLLGFRF